MVFTAIESHLNDRVNDRSPMNSVALNIAINVIIANAATVDTGNNEDAGISIIPPSENMVMTSHITLVRKDEK